MSVRAAPESASERETCMLLHHPHHSNGFFMLESALAPLPEVCCSLNGCLVGNRNSQSRYDAARSQRHRSKCALHRRGRANVDRQPLP